MINVTDKTQRELNKTDSFLKPVVRIKYKDQGFVKAIYLSTTPHSTISVYYDDLTFYDPYLDMSIEGQTGTLPAVTFLPLIVSLPTIKDSYDFKSQKWQKQTSRFEINNEPSLYLNTETKSNVRFSEAFSRNAFTNAVVELGLIPDSSHLGDVVWIMSGTVKYTTYTHTSFIIETEDFTSTLFEDQVPNPKMWYSNNMEEGGMDVYTEFRGTPYPMVFGVVDNSPCKFSGVWENDFGRHTVTRIDVDQEFTASGKPVRLLKYNWKDNLELGGSTFVIPPLTILEGDSFLSLVDELDNDQGGLEIPYDPSLEEEFDQEDRNFTWHTYETGGTKPYIGINAGEWNNSVSADKLRVGIHRNHSRVQALMNHNNYLAEWYTSSGQKCYDEQGANRNVNLPLHTQPANHFLDNTSGGLFLGDQEAPWSSDVYSWEGHHDQYLCLRFTFDPISWDESCYTWVIIDQEFETENTSLTLDIYDDTNQDDHLQDNYNDGWNFSQVTLHAWTFTKNRQSDKVLLTDDDGTIFDPTLDYIGDEHTNTFYSYEHNNIPIIQLKTETGEGGKQGSRLEDYPGRTKKIFGGNSMGDEGPGTDWLGNHRGSFTGSISWNYDNHSGNTDDGLWDKMVGRPSKKGVSKEGMFQTFGSAEEIFYGLPRFMCLGLQNTDVQTLAINNWKINHFSIYQMGFIDKLSERKYFVDVSGRIDGDGALLENPVRIMAHIFSEELQFKFQENVIQVETEGGQHPQEAIEDMVSGNDHTRWYIEKGIIDYKSLEIAESVIGGWKFAFTIIDPIKVKDLVEGMFYATPVFPKLKYSGQLKYAVHKLKYGEEDYNQAFPINNDDIISHNFDRTKQDDIKTQVKVNYNYNYATEKFDSSTSYATLSNLNEFPDVELETPEGDTIWVSANQFVLEYYNLQGSQDSHIWSTFEYDCPYVRDTDTADMMRDYLLRQYCNDHIIIELELPLSYLRLEVGDVVKFPKLINNELAFGINYTMISSPARVFRYPLFQITEVQNLGNKLKLKLLQLHNLSDVMNDINTNGEWSTYWFSMQPSSVFEEDVTIPAWQVAGGFWGGSSYTTPNISNILTGEALEQISVQNTVTIPPQNPQNSTYPEPNPKLVAFKYFTHFWEGDEKTHLVPALPPYKIFDPSFFTFRVHWTIGMIYFWLAQSGHDQYIDTSPISSQEISKTMNYLKDMAGADQIATSSMEVVEDTIKMSDIHPDCLLNPDLCWEWTLENLGYNTIVPFILHLFNYNLSLGLSHNQISKGRIGDGTDSVSNISHAWPCLSATFFYVDDTNFLNAHTWLNEFFESTPIGGPTNRTFFDIENVELNTGLTLKIASACWLGDPYLQLDFDDDDWVNNDLRWNDHFEGIIQSGGGYHLQHTTPIQHDQNNGWWTWDFAHGGSSNNNYWFDEYSNEEFNFKGLLNSQATDYEESINLGQPLAEWPMELRCWVRFENNFPRNFWLNTYTEVDYRPTNALMTVWNSDMLTFENAIWGDANNDGGVNVLDIVTIVNATIGQGFYDTWGYFLADVNGDGEVNIFDIVQITNYLVDGTPLGPNN